MFKARGPSRSSSEDSEFGADRGRGGLAGALALPDDPRTLSQIKRSRIDLDRRYVFLCATSLSKNFEVLPHQAKDSALLVLKCSREWLVRDPADIRRRRAQSRVECGVPKNAKGKRNANNSAKAASLSAAACHGEFSKEFMQWVLTKEKEGCIFWWKPEKDFQKLSKFLEEKIDPVNEQPYRPLLLDPQWWRVHFARTSARFCNNPAIVIANISDRSNAGNDKRDVSIPALQELIYQSNPTLEPISKWPYAGSMRFVPKPPPSSRDFVGQYANFKGYIDQGSLRSADGVTNQLDDARIPQWPQTPRERYDDLHRSWQMEDAVIQRQTMVLPELSKTAPPSARGERTYTGGLFGLGFGTGVHGGQRLKTAGPLYAGARLNVMPVDCGVTPSATPPGSSRGVRAPARNVC